MVHYQRWLLLHCELPGISPGAMDEVDMSQDANGASANRLLKRVVPLAGQEGDLLQEAQVLLGKRVRRVTLLNTMALEELLPPGTLGRVIEVAQPMWFFAKQDGSPQPEHTMEVSEPILTVVWDMPNSEDTFETSLHWDEYLNTVSKA
jgi:hypothetical protein